MLRRVKRYVWIEPDGVGRGYLDAESWWPLFPGITEDEHGRHIVVAEEFEHCREPDAELLDCGHEQPIRTSKRVRTATRQYYNRRRRCDQCAMEAFCGRV